MPVSVPDWLRLRPWLASRSRWGLAVAVAVVVTGASIVPESVLRAAAGALPVGGGGSGTGTGTGPFPPWLRPDVVAHVVGYAAVAATVACALDGADAADRSTARALGVAFAAAVGLGAAVELLQPLVGRGFSWFDLAGNAVGAAVGCVLWWRRSRRCHRDA